jgi:hypothetical protein
MDNKQDNQIDSFVPSSSFLEKAEYDKKTYTLTLTFKNGNQYKHLYFFPSAWLSFKSSPDHSSYYANVIKGKSLSVAIKKSNIGKVPKPLKTLSPKHPLSSGLKELKPHGRSANSRNNSNTGKRNPGTVPNGFR